MSWKANERGSALGHCPSSQTQRSLKPPRTPWDPCWGTRNLSQLEFVPALRWSRLRAGSNPALLPGEIKFQRDTQRGQPQLQHFMATEEFRPWHQGSFCSWRNPSPSCKEGNPNYNLIKGKKKILVLFVAQEKAPNQTPVATKKFTVHKKEKSLKSTLSQCWELPSNSHFSPHRKTPKKQTKKRNDFIGVKCFPTPANTTLVLSQM